MKYQVFVSPADNLQGCQRWYVRIVLPDGTEEQTKCSTQGMAEMWIGDRVMAHAAAHLETWGAKEMADYV